MSRKAALSVEFGGPLGGDGDAGNPGRRQVAGKD